MNCPTCLSIMSSKNGTNPKTYKMSLHCHNQECPAFIKGYIPHVMVIAKPDQTWICEQYHLPFPYKNKWFALVGEPFLGYLDFPRPTLMNIIQPKQTTLYEIEKKYYFHGIFNSFIVRDEKGEIISTPFVNLSTDNDMHNQAQHLFNRLVKLVVFA